MLSPVFTAILLKPMPCWISCMFGGGTNTEQSLRAEPKLGRMGVVIHLETVLMT